MEEEATTVPDTPAPVIDMLSLDDPVPAPSGGGGSSGLDDLLSMDSKPAAPAKPSGMSWLLTMSRVLAELVFDVGS